MFLKDAIKIRGYFLMTEDFKEIPDEDEEEFLEDVDSLDLDD